jgi:hypothetical protein
MVKGPLRSTATQPVGLGRKAKPVPSMSTLRSSKREVTPWWPNLDNLNISHQAFHDYFGLVYYWSRGWL